MAGYVLAGLTKRRAALTGEADTLKARLAQIGTDLGHFDAVTRQFDPDHDLGSTRPKRSRGPGVARRGEVSRFALGVLRDAAGPMPTPDVAARLTMERSMGGQDRKLVERVTKRIVSTLRHQGQKGTVRSQPGTGRVLLWEIACQADANTA